MGGKCGMMGSEIKKQKRNAKQKLKKEIKNELRRGKKDCGFID